MEQNHIYRRNRRLRQIARRLTTLTLRGGLCALLLSVLLGAGMTHADGTREQKDPHQSSASDGSTPEPSEKGVVRTGRDGAYVAGFEGTGELIGKPGPASGPEGTGSTGGLAGPAEKQRATLALPDNRVWVDNTLVPPYRTIAFITTSLGRCSGWMVSPDTAITAAHCLYKYDVWATNVVVYPGRNSAQQPFGSCKGRRTYVTDGWKSTAHRNYDYGAIKLDCTIGYTTGWLGYRWQSGSMTGQPAATAGYPKDRAYATMWRSSDQVRITATGRLFYGNFTAQGQSGAPVWNSYGGCSSCAIAIHTSPIDQTGDPSGVRITYAVFNNLTAWANAQ